MSQDGGTTATATAASMKRSRGLFIWTPNFFDRNFQARFFANRVIDSLIDAGLSLNDFYYDPKEKLLDNPLRCSNRMRAAEQCQAAILFLLWPSGDKNENNSGPSPPSSEQQLLLSVAELAELSCLCVRSMRAAAPEQEQQLPAHLQMMVNRRGVPPPPAPIKLYVICQQGSMQTTLLPAGLDYALTQSGHYSVVRMPFSPGDSGISTSQLREMSGIVASELCTIGISEWCRSPTVMASRAAWLSTGATQRGSTGGPLEVKMPSPTEDAAEEVQQAPVETWKDYPVIDWSPEMVQEFLAAIKIPEVITMRIDELALDGSELAVMSVNDFHSHCLVDNMEICRILKKKISQQMGSHSMAEFAYNAHRQRQLNKIYMIFDPRDAKLAANIRRQLARYNFEIYQHGQLGRSRSEFALGQIHRLAHCTHFVFLLTETALSSPFVWEEACLLRSIINPPASNIITLSWNIGATFYAPDMFFKTRPKPPGPNSPDDLLPIPSVILLLADVQNVPLMVQCDMYTAMVKVTRLIEQAIRPPPPGIVFSPSASNEFDDVLAPNASLCDSLMFQPLLSNIGAGGNVVTNSPKLTGRYGHLVSNFLQPFSGTDQPTLPFADLRMEFLRSIYISPPVDVVILCDWSDAKSAAVPLLEALRAAGLRCFADFENPIQNSQVSLVPKSRLRLLLLTATAGHLRPSHPLLSTAISESPIAPLLFVLCSRSQIAGSEEIHPSKTGALGVTSSISNQTHADGYFGYQQSMQASTQPSALLLDLSSSRGISRFVAAICRYFGFYSNRLN